MNKFLDYLLDLHNFLDYTLHFYGPVHINWLILYFSSHDFPRLFVPKFL